MKFLNIRDCLICFVIAIGFMGFPAMAFRLAYPAMDMASREIVGEEFLPLRPYIIGRGAIGFITDIDHKGHFAETSIPFMYSFEQAQFVLSPVYLDHIHPEKYCLVVAVVRSEKGLESIISRIGGHVSWGPRGGVTIIRRDDVGCLDRL